MKYDSRFIRNNNFNVIVKIYANGKFWKIGTIKRFPMFRTQNRERRIIVWRRNLRSILARVLIFQELSKTCLSRRIHLFTHVV